jgi:hypothetical protein
LKNLSELEGIPKPLSDEPIITAFRLAEIAAYNEAERFAYHRSLKYFRDTRAQMEYAIIKGREVGMAEGRVEGAIAALRVTLLLQLREKFGEIPQDVEKQIESIESIEKLNLLLKQVVKANSLSELGFEM